MDHLRQGIGLRGYGQKDPKQEYKKEGYEGFIQMLSAINHQFVSQLMRVQAAAPGGGDGAAAAADGARGSGSARRGARRRGGQARSRPRRRAARTPAQRAGPEGRPQRPVPLRQRQEVQEVPRRERGPAELRPVAE